MKTNPDSKVLGANMGPTWVLSAPDGPHDGPMNPAIREVIWHMYASAELSEINHDDIMIWKHIPITGPL